MDGPVNEEVALDGVFGERLASGGVDEVHLGELEVCWEFGDESVDPLAGRSKSGVA